MTYSEMLEALAAGYLVAFAVGYIDGDVAVASLVAPLTALEYRQACGSSADTRAAFGLGACVELHRCYELEAAR